jgi:hypothetical protein
MSHPFVSSIPISIGSHEGDFWHYNKPSLCLHYISTRKCRSEIIAGDQNFEPLHIRTFSVRNKFLCYQRTQFPPVGPDSYRDRAVKKINHEIG